LITGVEYSRENSDNRPRTGSVMPLADLYNPQPGQSYNDVIDVAAFENEATSDSVSLYGFETLAVHEKLDLVGGVRWDYFNTLFVPSTNSETLHRIDKNFSWRGGVVFKPVETGSIYFGYGTSFNPTAEGLALSSAANNAANLLLNPEETRTFEIGTKWDVLEERLALTAAIFRTDKTNARATDPGIAAGTADDTVVLQGQQRVHGMEFGVAGNVTEEWKMFAGYTAMDSDITETVNPAELGKDLPNTPSQSFSIWTTYQLPLNLEIGGGIQFVDTRFNSSANTRKAPEFWLFDLMAAYKLTENITLRINAANLTDQEYIGSLGGGHFIPGTGRSIIAATEFDF
jgi:catecholate siderophore receptor